MTTTTISGAGSHASAAATDRIPASKAGVKGYLTNSQVKDYIIGLANTWAQAQTFPQTGVKFSSTAAEQFELRARTVSSSTLGGVPYFRSTTTNRSTAFDIMPNGVGGDATGEAWIHVLDRDIGDAGANWQAAVLACLSTGEVRIGSHAGGTGTYQPVKIGGTTIGFNSQTYGSPDQYGYFSNVGLYLGRSGTEYAQLGLTSATLRSGYIFKWTDGAHIGTGTVDVGIGRPSGEKLEINNGTAGTWRDLDARAIQARGGSLISDTNVWCRGDAVPLIFGASLDLWLHRDAANVAAFRNGTTAQSLRVYSTWTNASNYERGALNAGSDYIELAAETAGTGDDDLDVRLTPAGAGNVRFGTHSAAGGESFTGFITIKDAAGNARKLAVFS